MTIVSQNNGKYISGETRVRVNSDENGNLPVIVRNPDTAIKIVADGKESNSIIQKANEKQKAILNDFKVYFLYFLSNKACHASGFSFNIASNPFGSSFCQLSQSQVSRPAAAVAPG